MKALQFADRAQAGRALAAKLEDYAGRDGVVVLALPRGGVPVGYEVAIQLRAPLDIITVRKLGVPGHEELAMGAIASGGFCAMNPPSSPHAAFPTRNCAKPSAASNANWNGANSPCATDTRP